MKSMLKRVTVGATLGGALLLSAGMGTANAAPRDGQIDVIVGTAGVLQNVPLSSAVKIAAGVCSSDATQLTQAAETVDASGTQQNVCTNEVGAVAFRQNDGTAAVPQGFAGQPAAEAPEAVEAPEGMMPGQQPTASPDAPGVAAPVPGAAHAPVG